MLKNAVAILGAFYLLITPSSPAFAQVPALPHAFYGELKINGVPAPAGTVVEARGAGVLTGTEGSPLTTTVTGMYGGEGALTPKLVVQGDIADGAAISFYVNGTAAVQTAQWQSGAVTRLDLSVTVSSGGSNVGGGGGGGGAASPSTTPVNLNGLSSDTELNLDASGTTRNDYLLSDAEGKITLALKTGTTLKSASGTSLAVLSLERVTELPPAPPQKTVVISGEFGPSGATFNPPIVLTFAYDPAALPQGAAEDSLVVASLDGVEWQMLESTVDTAAGTVSARVSHLSIFAVLAQQPATLSIISPLEGATIESGNISVAVNVSNFNLKVPGGEPASGEGHIHFYLDIDMPTTPGESAETTPETYKGSPKTTVTWEDVAPGTHTFGVQLVNNDHTPLSPPVTATVTVSVIPAPASAPVPAPPSPPTPPPASPPAPSPAARSAGPDWSLIGGLIVTMVLFIGIMALLLRKRWAD